MIVVPRAFADLTVAREGEAGRRWIDTLPGLVAELLDRWTCRPDGRVRHGEVALVVPVVRSGDRLVIKVSFPHPGNLGEAPALRFLDGRGAVRLIEAGESGLALLLERAGDQTLAESTDADSMIEIAGGLAREMGVPAPAVLSSLASTTADWLDDLDHQVRETPGVINSDAEARARATIAFLSDDATPTFLHGDLHAGNVLAAEREAWLCIDPKGWRGTAAFDGFTVVMGMREQLREASDLDRALRARADRYATAAGVDRDLVIACCQARAVSSLLYQAARTGDWFDRRLLEAATLLAW